MSRKCELTGKGVQSGNRVSHAKNRTKHRFLPNLQKKKFWSETLNKFVSLKVATSTIRTIDKLGVDKYAAKLGIKLK
jgi:large subunit ribosomal protein L28